MASIDGNLTSTIKVRKI